MTATNSLVIAFPPQRGYNGACTTILDVSRHGLTAHSLGLTPTKRAAVSLIVSASMERSQNYGHGNKAAKRIIQLMKSRAPSQETALKDGSEVAVYHGWQDGFGVAAGFALYNLTQPVGIHPAGSTVSDQTLNRLGYSAPDMYASRSTDDAGELLAN